MQEALLGREPKVTSEAMAPKRTPVIDIPPEASGSGATGPREANATVADPLQLLQDLVAKLEHTSLSVADLPSPASEARPQVRSSCLCEERKESQRLPMCVRDISVADPAM
jgi:hypothetical protein